MGDKFPTFEQWQAQPENEGKLWHEYSCEIEDTFEYKLFELDSWISETEVEYVNCKIKGLKASCGINKELIGILKQKRKDLIERNRDLTK